MNKGVFDSLLCRNYGLKGHTIDKYFEIIGYPPGFKRNPNLKPTNSFNNNKSNNVEFKKSSLGNNDSKTSGNMFFTSEQVMKLMNILNDKSCPTGQSNMAGVNQHMTNSTRDMIDVVNVSDLKLIVGYPNGTLSKITHVGNLKLNNDVMLFNVLVIPEYTDLKRRRVLGTGNEFAGLYSSDKEYNKSVVSNNSKFFARHDSKQEGPSGRDGNVHLPDLDVDMDQPKFDEHRAHSGSDSCIHQPGNDCLNIATPIDDNRHSEGNVGTSKQVPRLNRYANHTFLDAESSCFISNLNTSSEPSSFEEASKDPNWISVINDEMNALYENGTWILADLLFGRKPIGKVEYRSMAAATCKIMWIVKVMKDLNVDNLLLVELHRDNKFAMQIAANLVMHEKTNHFDLYVRL
nr:hypothetical protein [Tanacetum cinerariifolium]